VAGRLKRVVFIEAGQSPRDDIVPEIVLQLNGPIDPVERGALDGLSAAEIAALTPGAGEASLVTRLRSGQDVVVSKAAVGERMAAILAGLRPREFDLVVILSTGLLREFDSPTPMVNAQRAIESGIRALAAEEQRLGIVQPIARQIEEVRLPTLADYPVTLSHAMPGDRDALARAILDLGGCEVIVLNSVAFDERDRAIVARATGRPVVLARRIVAGAIRLLLDQGNDPSGEARGGPADYGERLSRLTPRERQVLSLMAEGLTSKAIGRQLAISPKTVEIHRSKVMGKMEVASLGALIRLVLSSEHPEP
jgi:protein AroM